MTTAQKQIQALYVTWQDPATMRYIPIGRLIGGLGPEQPEYEFCYLQGSHEANHLGFDWLLSFPDLNAVYRSNEMFPLFQNRLMSPNRAEYREFVSNLAVDPDQIDLMAILMRSGGGRVTDSLEMFEVPRLSEEGNPFKTHFLAHGLRYLSESSQERILQLKPNDPLFIMSDCQNAADGDALALRTEDRVIIGYLPRYLLGDATKLLRNCEVVECFVAQVNPPPAPLQQRLLCRLEACWPNDFRPFAADSYKPISAEARDLTSWSNW
jgi:hypothetical protein